MKEEKNTEWIAQADAAMKRAAQRARELAERTGTALHVMRDGKIVRLDPAKKDKQ